MTVPHSLIRLGVALAMALASVAGAASADDVLFRNVRVFDGHSPALSPPSDVRVSGNLIARVSQTPLPEDGARVIDGAGMVLMPGLIDAHWHTILARPTAEQAIIGDIGFTNILAAVEAQATLMRGFTTVRDMGGPAFGLKRAIDIGLVPGPRIYPSGAMLTTTGGHGDFRFPYELPREDGELTRSELSGGSMIVDGPDEVLRRVREQLMLGASQIKLTAGGGVASPHSPLDVATFTEAEMRAAVDAATNWGTYVCVHAYTPIAIQTAIAAGVRCVEHAHLMDDATAALMAEKGVWLSTQPFEDGGGTAEAMSPESRAKKTQVAEGTAQVYVLARKYGIRTAFGTDILFSAAEAARQNDWLLRLLDWYTPAEILAMATGTNGELLQMSGPRNPYPGRLGVVEEGALADLLLVDGDPLADLSVIADPAANFRVIMKDGRIVRDSLTPDAPASP